MMRVITEVKSITVSESPQEINYHEEICITPPSEKDLPMRSFIPEREMVYGETYTDGRGKRELIGVTRKAREAMGLYAVVAETSAELFSENRHLRDEVGRKSNHNRLLKQKVDCEIRRNRFLRYEVDNEKELRANQLRKERMIGLERLQKEIKFVARLTWWDRVKFLFFGFKFLTKKRSVRDGCDK